MDPCVVTQLFMGDIDDNQYQSNHTIEALQRTIVARQNLAVSNEEAKKRQKGDLTTENNKGETFEVTEQNTNNDRDNNEENEQNNAEQREDEAENKDIREIRIRFMENLVRFKKTTKETIEERERLMKLKEKI